MPANEDLDVFVEAYGGAANLLVSRERNAYTVEVYNDINAHMVNLFRVLRGEQSRELWKRMEWSLYSSDEFWESVRKLRVDEYEDDVDHAMATIYYLTLAMVPALGHLDSDESIAMRRKYNQAQQRPNAMDMSQEVTARLKKLAVRMSYVCIENKPALELIDTYDRDNNAKGAVNSRWLLYLDPPYVLDTRINHEKRYSVEMTDKEHRLLLNKILKLKNYVAISNYDNDIYNNILGSAGWDRQTMEFNGKTEVLWRNQQCVEATQASSGMFDTIDWQ